MTTEQPRRYVSSRYASRYTTPDGSLPSTISAEDVYPEDATAMTLAQEYFQKGETLLSNLSWFTRTFRLWHLRSLFEAERNEADKLARIVHSEGSPLIAAFIRVAHSFTGPENQRRRNRLIDISIAASRNTQVPPLKRHDLT